MAEKEGSGLPILSWFDEPIKQSIRSVFHELNTATEAMDLFKKYRNKHFASLKAALANVKILGMSQPVSLVKIYSPAFASTTIQSRLFEPDWHSAKSDARSSTEPTQRIPRDVVRADGYVESTQRIVVLGGPGSGKTTFLRYIALAYAERDIFRTSRLKTSKFPIFVPLLAFAERKDKGSSFFQYIAEELQRKTDQYAEYFIKRVLEKGLATVLLDGLDEVPSAQRKDVITRITDLCQTFPDTKVVLSCRTADYSGPFEEFYEVELAKLTTTAVHRVIKAWFAHDPKKAHQLIQHLRRDPDVQSLTETPLLLSLLCIQFRHDLSLPKRKTELYQRCIDAFLRDWDAGRGFRRNTAYMGLSDERKERIFEDVAGRYFADELQYHFPESDLCEAIGSCCERFGIPKEEAKNVLKEIEAHHGILERFSVDKFTFSHPSFHEYFAARYFLSIRKEFDAVKKHFDDTRWATAIEFIVSMHPNPIDILRFLKEQSSMVNLKYYPAMARRTQRLWLLYRCLNSGAELRTDVRQELYTHLVDSQISMSKIYENGGVFPIAALMKDGVRHAHAFFHKRSTLYDALQPFRLLSNEILLSPSEEYANIVLARLEQLPAMTDWKGRVSYPALVLCLVVPLTSSKQKEVLAWLERIIKDHKYPSYLADLARESKSVAESSYAVHSGESRA